MHTQVKLPKEFKAELKEDDFKEAVIKFIEKLKNLETKRLHPLTTRLVCTVIENDEKVQKYKLNKKTISDNNIKNNF